MGYQADWEDLTGRQVLFQKEGRTVQPGRVEGVGVPADVLWLATDGLNRTQYALGNAIVIVSEPVGCQS